MSDETPYFDEDYFDALFRDDLRRITQELAN